jgi:hypothetical protein
MKMPLSLFPSSSWTREQYNLDRLAKNGFVYLEMNRAVWGLPQAGILANKLLQKRLLPHGYYECKHTPGLWRQDTSKSSCKNANINAHQTTTLPAHACTKTIWGQSTNPFSQSTSPPDYPMKK